MRSSPLVAGVDKALRGLGTPSAGETVVVGLSGGPDSVALLDALVVLGRRLGYQVVAAHLDHGLRPDSGDDAEFCRELCRHLDIPLRTGVAAVRDRARRDKGGLEDAARTERYAFLRSVRRETGAVAIAVAHTRDDQVETVLLRLLRGSGSLGLSGMRLRSHDVIRPLLGITRASVIEHLQEHGLPWREDPSNADTVFLRNRIRHELLPYLERHFNPRVREAVARTAELLTDESTVIERAGRSLLGRLARLEEGGVTLLRAELKAADRAVARAALRHALSETGGLAGVSATHVDRILTLASSTAPSGRRLFLPGNREAVYRFDCVWIGSRSSRPAPFVRALSVPGMVELPGGMKMVARPAQGPSTTRPCEAVIPADHPLEVRTRRSGDRISTGGRVRSLKRFLIERRVPADRRGELPLVAAGTMVLWVPGQLSEKGGAEAARFARVTIEAAASPPHA